MGLAAQGIRRAVVPASSVDDTVGELHAQLAPTAADVVLVFASTALPPSALAPALARGLAPARVVGCTSIRELAGASRAGSVVALAFPSPTFRLGVGLAAPLAHGPLGMARAAMVAAARELGHGVDELDRGRHVAVALVDGNSPYAEGFCLGSAAAAPRIGIVGGAASDDRSLAHDAAVFIDGEHHRDAGVVIVIETERRFTVLLSEHMVPTDTRVVVTSADPTRRRLVELDGYPAATRYRQAIRALGAEGELDAALVAEYPFAMYVDGRPYVRSIRGVAGDELLLAAAVDQGTVLRIMRPSDLVVQTAAAVAEARRRIGELELLLSFSCTGRNLEAERKGLCAALDRVYATAPVFGFDSFGEQFGPLLVNHTLVALAIGGEGAS